MWAGFLAYLGVLWTAPRIGVRVVGALVVVAVVAFACAPVLLSHDAFSYVDYARLGVRHGLDPYVTPPEAVPVFHAPVRCQPSPVPVHSARQFVKWLFDGAPVIAKPCPEVPPDPSVSTSVHVESVWPGRLNPPAAQVSALTAEMAGQGLIGLVFARIGQVQ